MEWSKPYYGVQHLSGTKPRVYATVADYDSHTNAYILNFASGCGFTPIVERDFDNPAAARVWIEQQARTMRLFAQEVSDAGE